MKYPSSPTLFPGHDGAKERRGAADVNSRFAITALPTPMRRDESGFGPSRQPIVHMSASSSLISARLYCMHVRMNKGILIFFLQTKFATYTFGVGEGCQRHASDSGGSDGAIGASSKDKRESNGSRRQTPSLGSGKQCPHGAGVSNYRQGRSIDSCL